MDFKLYCQTPMKRIIESTNGIGTKMTTQSGGDMRALGLTVRSADYLTHWTVRIIRPWTQMANTLRCVGNIVRLIDGEFCSISDTILDPVRDDKVMTLISWACGLFRSWGLSRTRR